MQYGVRAGMPELDARADPFRRWLAEVPGGKSYLFGSFYSTLVASLLALAGYRDDAVVRTLYDRLVWSHEFCKKGRYDIHVDKAGFRGIPKVWANVPLIDPAIYPGDNLRLPWIHDLNGYAAHSRTRLTPVSGTWSTRSSVTYWTPDTRRFAKDTVSSRMERDAIGLWGGAFTSPAIPEQRQDHRIWG